MKIICSNCKSKSVVKRGFFVNGVYFHAFILPESEPLYKLKELWAGALFLSKEKKSV